MNKFQQVKQLVASMEDDATKFYEKNNSAAGTRLRNSLQQLKGLCKEARDEVSGIKNSATK